MELEIAPDKDKRRKLYDSLVGKGQKLPDYETFSKDMADPAKVKALHESSLRNGYPVPKDLATFDRDIASDLRQPPFPQPPPQGANLPSPASSTGQPASLGGSSGSASMGTRLDGTPKGSGWLGPIPTRDGQTMTELSFDFDTDGQKVFAPLLVPTLNKEEVDHLAGGGKPTEGIYKKAQDFALQRQAEGKSPFKDEQEPPRMVDDMGDGVMLPGTVDQTIPAQPQLGTVPQAELPPGIAPEKTYDEAGDVIITPQQVVTAGEANTQRATLDIYHRAKSERADLDKEFESLASVQDNFIEGTAPWSAHQKRMGEVLDRRAYVAKREEDLRDYAQEEINSVVASTIKKGGDSLYMVRDGVGKVADPAKIQEQVDKVSEELGINDEEFRKNLYNKMLSNVDMAPIAARANEIAKQRVEPLLEKERSRFKEGFKSDAEISARATAQIDSIGSVIQVGNKQEQDAVLAGANEVFSSITAPFKDAEQRYKQVSAQIQQQVNAGLLPYEQGVAMLGQATAEYDSAYDKYRDEWKATSSKLLNESSKIAARYNQKYQQEQRRILDAANKEITTAAEKYAKEFKDDPQLSGRIKAAYESAWSDANKERDKGVSAAEKDRNNRLLTTGGMGSTYGAMLAAADVYFRSAVNGLGGAFKGMSTTLGSDTGYRLGEEMERAYYMPKAKSGEWSDLLDPLNVAALSGQLSGAMAPSMAAAAAAAAGTGGAGAPAAVQIVASALAGWGVETTDIAGRAKDQVLAQGGDLEKANKAWDKSFVSQVQLLPAYSFDGLPFVSGVLRKIPTVAGRVAVGAGTEYVTEMFQEIPQNVAERNILAGKEAWDDFAEGVLDPQNKEVLISMAPIAILGGGGQITSKSAKSILEKSVKDYVTSQKVSEFVESAPAQWTTAMTIQRGEKFAQAVLASMYQSGTITEQQLQQLEQMRLKSMEHIGNARDAGLNQKEASVYAAFANRADELRAKATDGTNPVTQMIAKARLSEVEKSLKEFVLNKEAQYVEVSYADPKRGTTTMSLDQARRMLSDEDFLKQASLLGLTKNGITINGFGAEGAALADEFAGRVATVNDRIAAMSMDPASAPITMAGVRQKVDDAVVSALASESANNAKSTVSLLDDQSTLAENDQGTTDSAPAKARELQGRGELGGGPTSLSQQDQAPLEGLPSKVEVPGRGIVEFGPNESVREAARKYAEKAGIPYAPPRKYVKVDPERSGRIASEFEKMQHAPNDPKVKASYKAMIDETLAQYQAIKDSGLKIEFIDISQGDPYANSPREAMIDVRDNNHLWVFPTDDGFGSSDDKWADNPMLEYTDEYIGGKRLRANDVFRIVHDYFGHVKEGVGFRADGEENAWRQHSAMYSDLARPAMTSETRGQNSWVNFGPNGEANRGAPAAETYYAPQKVGLLPDWVIKEGSQDEPSQPTTNEGLTKPSSATTIPTATTTAVPLGPEGPGAVGEGGNRGIQAAVPPNVQGGVPETGGLADGVTPPTDQGKATVLPNEAGAPVVITQRTPTSDPKNKERVDYAIPGFEDMGVAMVKTPRGWRPSIVVGDTTVFLDKDGNEQGNAALAAAEAQRILDKHGKKKVQDLVQKVVAAQAAKASVLDLSARRISNKEAEILSSKLSKAIGTTVVIDRAQFNKNLSEAGAKSGSASAKGFVIGSTVYLNPDKVSLDTPLHEIAGHILLGHLRNGSANDRALYGKIITLSKDAPPALVSAIKNAYPDLKPGTNEFWEEVFSTFVGVYQGNLTRAEGVLKEAQNHYGYLKRMFDAIAELFSRIGKRLGIRPDKIKEATTIGQLVDAIGERAYKGAPIVEGNKDSLKKRRNRIMESRGLVPASSALYTLQALQSKGFEQLRGKQVKRSAIEQAMNQQGVKEIEKEIMSDVLKFTRFSGPIIDFDDFANNVSLRITPLRKIDTKSYSDYGMDRLGGRATYGNPRTIIFNTPTVDHGRTGHFPSDFSGEATEWVLKEIPGADLWIAIDSKATGLPPEQMQAFIGTAGPKDSVEQWIGEQNSKEGGKQNKGMFGWIRKWFAGEGSPYYVAELQSDFYQKADVENELADKEVKEKVNGRLSESYLAVADALYDGVNKLNDKWVGSTGKTPLAVRALNPISDGKSSPTELLISINSSHFPMYGIPEQQANGNWILKDPFTDKTWLGEYATEKDADVARYDLPIHARPAGPVPADNPDLLDAVSPVLADLFKKAAADYKEAIKGVKDEVRASINPAGRQMLASVKTWEKRMIREAVQDAASQGATAIRFPTPNTLARIEGYAAARVFRKGGSGSADLGDMPYQLEDEDNTTLTVGEEITMEGNTYLVVEVNGDQITVADRDNITRYSHSEAIDQHMAGWYDGDGYEIRRQLEKSAGKGPYTKEQVLDALTDFEWVAKAVTEDMEDTPEKSFDLDRYETEDDNTSVVFDNSKVPYHLASSRFLSAIGNSGTEQEVKEWVDEYGEGEWEAVAFKQGQQSLFGDDGVWVAVKKSLDPKDRKEFFDNIQFIGQTSAAREFIEDKDSEWEQELEDWMEDDDNTISLDTIREKAYDMEYESVNDNYGGENFFGGYNGWWEDGDGYYVMYEGSTEEFSQPYVYIEAAAERNRLALAESNTETPAAEAKVIDQGDVDMSKFTSDQRTVLSKYVQIANTLRKERKYVEVVEDENGYSWLSSPLSQDEGSKPIVAFSKDLSSDISREEWNAAIDKASSLILTTNEADAIAKGSELIASKEGRKEFVRTMNEAWGIKEATKSAPEVEPERVKKTTVGRAYEGEFRREVKGELEKLGLMREVESHDEAEDQAKAIIEKMGIQTALDAVNRNDIKGGARAFIWEAAVLDLQKQAMAAKDPAEMNRLFKEQADLLDEMDAEMLSGGRQASAMQRVLARGDAGFSAERMKAKLKKDFGVDPSPELEEALGQIEELKAKIKDAEKRAAEAEAQAAVDAIKDHVAKQKKGGPAVERKRGADRIRSWKIGNKGIAFSSVIPPPVVDAAIEVVALSYQAGEEIAVAIAKGVKYIKGTDWYKKLTGDEQNAAAKALEDYLKTRHNEESDVESGYIRVPKKMIRDAVENGAHDIDTLVAVIKEQLQEEYPDATDREIRDAITDYGKVVNMSSDDISKEVRRLRRVGRDISALEDIQAKKRPLRSGLQRDKMDAEERARKKQIREGLKNLPVDAELQAKEIKTALDAAKTRARNRIEDLQREIDTKQKLPRNTKSVEADAELKALIAEKEALQEQHDAIFEDAAATEQERLDRAIETTRRSIEGYEQRIRDSNLDPQKKAPVKETPELKALRAQRDAAKAEYKKLQEDAGVIERKRDKAQQKAIQKAIDALAQRLRDKDFNDKPKKKERVESTEVIDLKADRLRIQEKFDKEYYKHKLANRTAGELAKDIGWEFWGLGRALNASLDASFVGVQGLMMSVSNLWHNPGATARAFKNSWNAMKSEEKSERWIRKVKAQEWYPKAKEAKLALTEAHAQLSAREESFVSEWTRFIWGMAGAPFFVKSKIDGGKAFDNWMALNPFRATERAAVAFLDTLRIERYLDGVEMLKANKEAGKEVTAKDYKDVADVVNTLTGRASLGKAEAMADTLTKLVYSPRLWSSQIKTFTPYGLYWLSKKSPTAQKMAVQDWSRFVGTTLGLVAMAAVYLNNDDDDETKVELDPRSSEYLKIKLGKNIVVDPWGGRLSHVIYTTRALAGAASLVSDKPYNAFKNRKGDILPLGIDHRSPTLLDLTLEVGFNKAAPPLSFLIDAARTTTDMKGNRKTAFGKEYHMDEAALERITPMIGNTVADLMKEEPNAMGVILSATAFFGPVQTYDEDKHPKSKYEQEASDIRSESIQRTKDMTDIIELYEAGTLTKEQADSTFKESFKDLPVEKRKSLVSSYKERLRYVDAPPRVKEILDIENTLVRARMVKDLRETMTEAQKRVFLQELHDAKVITDKFKEEYRALK